MSVKDVNGRYQCEVTDLPYFTTSFTYGFA